MGDSPLGGACRTLCTWGLTNIMLNACARTALESDSESEFEPLSESEEEAADEPMSDSD